MKCPFCRRTIPDEVIISEAAAVMGRKGRGKAKARNSETARLAGKLGGWPKGKKRKPKRRGRKFLKKDPGRIREAAT